MESILSRQVHVSSALIREFSSHAPAGVRDVGVPGIKVRAARERLEVNGGV